MSKFRDQMNDVQAGVTGADVAQYADWFGTHPLLCDAFIEPVKPGSIKGALSISLFYEECRIKCAITDKIGRMVAFTVIDDMDECWNQIERQMRDKTLDWRASKRY